MVDGLNHRVGKKRNGAFEQVFVYDGDRIAAELDGSGNVVSRFVYLSQAHSPDLVVKNDGSSYRLVKDHLGSIRLVVNQTSGAIVQQLDYDAWGNTTIVTDGATPFQPFGFAGGLWDRDTNLVRFGARDYDPATGRWTAKDTWRFDGGDWNLYAYVTSDPVNRFDPTGHFPFDGRDPPWGPRWPWGPGPDSPGPAPAGPGTDCNNGPADNGRGRCLTKCFAAAAVCVFVLRRNVEFCGTLYSNCVAACPPDVGPPN